MGEREREIQRKRYVSDKKRRDGIEGEKGLSGGGRERVKKRGIKLEAERVREVDIVRHRGIQQKEGEQEEEME